MKAPAAHTESFEQAITVVPSAPQSFTANLSPQWAVGDVPHGGYISAIIYRLACTYFRLRHQTRHGGHAAPIGLQLTFVRRCQTGPAELQVEDIKLGARTSIVHITLSQLGRTRDKTVRVVAHVTMSNLRGETGLSLSSDWTLSPPPPPPYPQLQQMTRSRHWEKVSLSYPSFRKAPGHVEIYGPSDVLPSHGPSITDQWAALRWTEEGRTTKGRWTNEAVAFLLDVFPAVLAKLEKAVNSAKEMPSPAWFPTLTLNIDFKKELPEDGVEWLYSRVVLKSIKHGRVDIEVVLLEESGEIVALATQAGLILDSKRNRPRI